MVAGQAGPAQRPLMAEEVFKNVQVLKGRANASRRIEELGLKARQTFWGLVPAHVDDILAPVEESPDIPLLERGIKMRTVYLQSMTVSKLGLEFAAAIHKMGGEVRATPTLPMRLLIIDQEIAIMPIDPEVDNAFERAKERLKRLAIEHGLIGR